MNFQHMELQMKKLKKISKRLELSENDAFIIVADKEEKARNAITEVQRRAKIALVSKFPKKHVRHWMMQIVNTSDHFQRLAVCTLKQIFQLR